MFTSCLPLTLACRRLFVVSLTSQQHGSVPQGRISSDKFTHCHTETEVADRTFHLIQSQYIDTGPTSPSADPISPGAWQGSANFEVTGMTRPGKIPSQAEFKPRIFPLEEDALTTRPTRRSYICRRTQSQKEIFTTRTRVPWYLSRFLTHGSDRVLESKSRKLLFFFLL